MDRIGQSGSFFQKIKSQDGDRLTWIIMSVALLIRLLWAFFAPRFDPVLIKNPLHGDALSYYNLAENMLNGYGFTFTGTPTAFRMPGYPVFLAGLFSIFGFNLPAVRISQAILGTLTLVPIFWIARSIGGNKVGLLAGLGLAFHPILIYMTGWIYSETLYIFLLWLALWFFICLINNPKISSALAAGSFFGLAALVRPEAAILPLFLMIALFLLKSVNKTQLGKLAVVQMAAIIILLPWSVRNSLIFHAFIPLTTSAGLNFQAGNNPESEGGSAFQYFPTGVSEPDADRALLREGLDWIVAHPTEELKILPKKIYKFFSPIEFETQSQTMSKMNLGIHLVYWAFLLIGWIGFWNYRSSNEARVIFLLLSAYLINAITFFGGSRVGLPASPGLVILAAAGIMALLYRQKMAQAK